MKDNSRALLHYVCILKVPPPWKCWCGGGFRAAKSSAASSGATRRTNQTIHPTLPPAISRAEFSQRENSHHPETTSEMRSSNQDATKFARQFREPDAESKA